MKPHLLKVSLKPEASFSIRKDVTPFFYNRWHYHPEIELLYIEKGTGTQFVGNSIKRFKDGDVLLIGSGLPHYWRCDDKYFAGNPRLRSMATVAHFNETFWGKQFLELPENRRLKELFKNAKKGIKIPVKIKGEIIRLLQLMLTATDTTKVILLLQCLDLIARIAKPEMLCTEGFQPDFEEKENDRINNIYAYTLANFRSPISTADIAKVACLSPHSFCRYFKSRTRKNYSRLLQELRVGDACKLLIESDKTPAQICMESGFNNITNFYRYFKEITGRTPNEYKKEHSSPFSL